ncbi:MAG: DMT family transporter, partial [Alphaproteobacteria bacterium]|nr:DMT family transporter [Alphaproteobacteria bacterium]
AMVGIFYSIAHIPLAQAMAINYSAPLFATLGAVLLLGEPVRMRRMVAVLIGFSGMLIVLRPGMQAIELGTLAAILGAMGMAASLLCIKRLSATENNSTIIVYGNTIGLPIALVLALGFWKWPSWEELGLLVAIGAFSTTAQLFLNRALALAEASAVLPVDFLRLVFVSLLGALLFAEPVNAFTWIGGAVILFSTVYIGHRESQAAKARGRKAVTPPSETP